MAYLIRIIIIYNILINSTTSYTATVSGKIKSIPNGRDKSRQILFLKKSTTTLTLQNMLRSINDHRQLQVVHDEFEFQCYNVNLRYYIAVRV